MKLQKTIIVTAVQAEERADIVWDCGALTIHKGEWLVEDEQGCFSVWANEAIQELMAAQSFFSELDEEENGEEERLREGLKTGHL